MSETMMRARRLAFSSSGEPVAAGATASWAAGGGAAAGAGVGAGAAA
ncbi:MAG: hypothetical protein NT056_05140 [Proteobacteria bacterium]|nr:hypothetical protein [Pseudomonadota bacterium]